jgi:hypothetical protein
MKYLSLTMKSFFAAVIIFVIPLTAMAADTGAKTEKMRLAVMDLTAKGKISNVTSSAISDLLRSDIVDTGRFVVVERSQMESIFKEQGLQMTGCTDNSCAVEMGKLVSANKIILGEVNQLNNNYIITLRVVDVAKGVAEFSTSEKTENINDIDKTVKSLAGKLTLRMTGKKPIEDYERPFGYYMRGIVPGWAQIYAGNSAKGWTFAGITVASAGFAGWAFNDYTVKKKKYDDLGPGASADEFNSKFNAKKDAANLANIGMYVFAGVYVINWIDVLLFNKYNPADTALLEDTSGYYFTINPVQNFQNVNVSEKAFVLGYSFKF